MAASAMPAPVLLGAALLLAWAAWSDLATRTIPDAASLMLAAGGVALRGAEGFGPLGASLAVSLALFLALALLHARGMIGGGDVKLLAALAIGLPPALALDLLVATALAGGVLAALYLLAGRILRRAPPALRPRRALALRVLAVEGRRIARRGPLPYALAIAAGALSTLIAGA